MQGLLKGCRPSGPRWTLSLDRPACRSGLDADVAATDTMQSRAESPRVSEIHVRCWWFLSESILYGVRYSGVRLDGGATQESTSINQSIHPSIHPSDYQIKLLRLDRGREIEFSYRPRQATWLTYRLPNYCLRCSKETVIVLGVLYIVQCRNR